VTKQEIAAQIRATTLGLVQNRGISPEYAGRIAGRAALRAAGLPIPAGLSDATTPTTPAAAPAAPAILADISAAGSSATVSTARDIVNKWSWILPVGGILMSLKQKVSSFRSPTSAAIVGGKRGR
jgi:hypothetical protein